jgi:hypothetical protein
MSAFICTDKHIYAIACAIYPQNPALAQALADKLKGINIDSVNYYRYNEKTRKTKCKPIPGGLLLNTDDIAKLMQSWAYQSCENPENIDFQAYRAFLYGWFESAGANPNNGKYWTI